MKKPDLVPPTIPTTSAPPPPAALIQIVNAQRLRPLDRRRARRLVEMFAREARQSVEVALHFISSRRSAALNRQFLNHEGPTDIITFDHGSAPQRLCGELFICVAEAVRQAREFGVTWQQEVDRYVIHGLLHLQGYDDRDPAARRAMKRAEDRWLRTWSRRGRDV